MKNCKNFLVALLVLSIFGCQKEKIKCPFLGVPSSTPNFEVACIDTAKNVFTVTSSRTRSGSRYGYENNITIVIPNIRKEIGTTNFVFSSYSSGVYDTLSYPVYYLKRTGEEDVRCFLNHSDTSWIRVEELDMEHRMLKGVFYMSFIVDSHAFDITSDYHYTYKSMGKLEASITFK